MRNITELTVLSRVTLELPDDLKVATEDFQEGWSFITSGDTHWMDKKVRSYGWHFIWIAEPTLRSGVAHTAQAAIASGLKLALRRINPGFNAASIDSIEVIEYPWFVIAKVRVCPYQVQQNIVLRMPDKAMPFPITAPVKPATVAGGLIAPIS